MILSSFTDSHDDPISLLHVFETLNLVFLNSQAIYVPADDLTDPAPATTFAHLDANTVLSRAISELGIYPAVDPLDSNSRIMDPNIVGAEHYRIARGVQKILQVGLLSFIPLLTSLFIPFIIIIVGLQVTTRYHCYPWYG